MIINAFVPAKGTSTRLENKNNQPIMGEPLYINALKKLNECKNITNFYIDTESEEFINNAKFKLPDCKWIKRDPNLATNATDGHQLLLNEAMNKPADIYVQLLGTSPFISPKSIDEAIKVLLENPEYDSVVGVRREKMYLWDPDKNWPIYDVDNLPNSFNLKDTIIETMGLYVIRHDALFGTKRRIGSKPYLYPLSPIESVDINTPEDYEFVKIIERGMTVNV